MARFVPWGNAWGTFIPRGRGALSLLSLCQGGISAQTCSSATPCTVLRGCLIPARGAPSPSVPPRGPTLHSGGSISLGQRLPPAQGEFSCPPACCAAIRQPQHLALLAAPRRSAGHVAGIGAALASYAPGKHPNHHPPALATHLNSFPKMSPEAWLPQPTRYLTGLSLLLALGKCRPEPCMRPAARGQHPAGGEAPSPNPASPFCPWGRDGVEVGCPSCCWQGGGHPAAAPSPAKSVHPSCSRFPHAQGWFCTPCRGRGAFLGFGWVSGGCGGLVAVPRFGAGCLCAGGAVGSVPCAPPGPAARSVCQQLWGRIDRGAGMQHLLEALLAPAWSCWWAALALGDGEGMGSQTPREAAGSRV